MVRWFKPVVFLACLGPLARLGWKAYTGRLGANPIEVITHSTGDWILIFLLVTLQFLFLNVAHVKLAASISFLLLLPIIVCSVLAFLLAGPINRIREFYHGAPHKKSIRKG